MRDLKKLDPPVRKFIYNSFCEIATSPYNSEKLSGPFRDLRSFHCKYKAVEYRVIYSINEEGQLIIIALVGTRENIYKELAKRL